MKVEHPRPNSSMSIEPAGLESTRPTAVIRGTTGSDRVELSGLLRLADAAVRAAGGANDVRPEAVQRGQALLESGQLDTDLDKLADRMLDAMTYSHDQESD